MLESLIGFGQSGSRSKTGIETSVAKKPVIGLALGGGAARGFAHIGILRTLLANGIVPDIVVGTSIGAVVGASYAAGHLDTRLSCGRRASCPATSSATWTSGSMAPA